MAKIPESYLPPPELRPKRIYNLDEFRNIPQKFNSTEVLLDQTAAKYGDKVAIYFDEQRVTYKQLQASVNRVANGLKKLGVEEGDRVLMRMPNIPPIIVCNFAIIKIGAVSLPTSVLFSRETVVHARRGCRACRAARPASKKPAPTASTETIRTSPTPTTSPPGPWASGAVSRSTTTPRPG
jgi:2-aminobenzoate-CoA ligase